MCSLHAFMLVFALACRVLLALVQRLPRLERLGFTSSLGSVRQASRPLAWLLDQVGPCVWAQGLY